MKNINPSNSQSTKRVGTLANQEIEKIAAKHEFLIRSGGQISTLILLGSFIMMMRVSPATNFLSRYE